MNIHTQFDTDFEVLKKVKCVKSMQDIDDIKSSSEYGNLKTTNLVNSLLNTCVDNLNENKINEDGTCSNVTHILEGI